MTTLTNIGTGVLSGDGAQVSLGSKTSKLYIQIADQCNGTLTGAGVAKELVKAEPLYAYYERVNRPVSAPRGINAFNSGAITADPVWIRIERTLAGIYLEDVLNDGNIIKDIKMYRVSDLAGKLTIIESIEWTTCYNEVYSNYPVLPFTSPLEEGDADMMWASFSFLQRKHTVFAFDPVKGTGMGQKVSELKLDVGGLDPAGGKGKK